MFDYQRVKILREFLQLSENKFAKSIGVSQSTYYRIERGEAKIDADAVSEIFRLYKVNPNWLFFGEGGDQPVFLDAPKKIEENYDVIELMKENLSMAKELKDVYKKLAEDKSKSVENLKNISMVQSQE